MNQPFRPFVKRSIASAWSFAVIRQGPRPGSRVQGSGVIRATLAALTCDAVLNERGGGTLSPFFWDLGCTPASLLRWGLFSFPR